MGGSMHVCVRVCMVVCVFSTVFLAVVVFADVASGGGDGGVLVCMFEFNSSPSESAFQNTHRLGPPSTGHSDTDHRKKKHVHDISLASKKHTQRYRTHTDIKLKGDIKHIQRYRTCTQIY